MKETEALFEAVRQHYTAICRCEWTEDDFTRTTTSGKCVIHGRVPDPLATLEQVFGRYEAALQAIAQADLPPDKRPKESNWSPSFWKWAPKIARKALGLKAYTPRWGWNDLV